MDLQLREKSLYNLEIRQVQSCYDIELHYLIADVYPNSKCKSG